MTSNVNPLVPGAGHAYTADVRANFLTIKNEIEALQAQAGTYGDISLFSFLTAAQIIDVRAGVLSFDASVPLQAAINFCNTLATYASDRSMVSLKVPAGNYLLSNQVTVKAHVILDGEGVLKNGLASAVTPALLFKKGSHCKRITLDANGQYGVQFGDAGVTNGMVIGDVRVLNGSLVAGQLGILFLGDNLVFENISIDGGRTGVAFGDGVNTCTRVRGDKIYCYNAFDGVTMDLCQSVKINSITLDSCTNSGLTIERSSDVFLPGVSGFFTDAAPGTCFASGTVITTGNAASAATKVNDLRIAAQICNTGGIGCTIGANILDSNLFLAVNRAILPTGNAHNCTTSLAYSGAINSSMMVTMCVGAGVTPTTGTVAGLLIYWDGTTESHSKPISAPSITLSTGTLRGKGLGRATVDQSLVTTVALTDVTGLGFAIAANEEWLAEFTLSVGAVLATTGIKVGVTTPAGATQQIDATLTPDIPTVTARDAKTTTAAATALDFTAAQQTTVGLALVKINVWILNGATPGTVQLQFAQSTSSATALTIKKGSAMIADRLA